MNTISFLSIPAGIVPEQEAVVSDGRRLTYAALLERVQRAAGMLAAHGVGLGTRVAALATNSHRYVEAYYATALLGGVFIPLNYRAKLPELEHMLRFGEARVLLVGSRYLPAVEELRPRLPHLEVLVGLEGAHRVDLDFEAGLASATPRAAEVEVDDDATTILMYTSGTTSLPKAVLLTFGDFTAYVTANVELADGTPRGAALLSAPLYHIAGATNMMTTLWTGRRLVVMPQFEAAGWLALAEAEGVTHAFVVPTMMKQLLDHPDLAQRDLSRLEVLSYGGAPMPFPVIRRAIETFPRTVGFVNAFGQTETTSTLTVLGPEDHRLEGSPEDVEMRLRRLRSLGRPLPDVEVRIVDGEGRVLRIGEIGEIQVRTARVMKGYAGMESPLTADGWLPTRDMGWLDEEGYVFLAGRKDDMIIRGGENIAPAEVEAVVMSHPAVDEVVVLGIADEEWGERIAAVVVPRPGATLDVDDLSRHCRARLASFKTPEIVRLVDELPRTPMGKVLRRELKALLEDERAAAAS